MIKKSKIQRGISLIESLVAIVVLAIGILGLIGFQLRTLADTQTSIKRAQAIKMIEDLSERLKVNPYPLLPATMANLQTNFNTAVPGPIVNCNTTPCDATQLARFDLSRWKANIAANLPFGDAAVFTVADETDPNNRRQLGVMVSWRENEKVNDTDYKNVFVNDTVGATCPANRICHLQYIQLTARCFIEKEVAGAGVVTTNCPKAKTENPNS